jgi:hypothetical protein
MIERHSNFRKKTLQEIRWWAWTAVAMLLSSVLGLSLLWIYGTPSVFNFFLTVGLSITGVVFLIWWWWALRAIKTLINHWDEINDNVKEVATEIKSLKSFIHGIFQRVKDK